MERSFNADNKLDPKQNAWIAHDLCLHPHQVAVWFQNCRARWKTKQIERDFATLRSCHDTLRLKCDSLRRNKDTLIDTTGRCRSSWRPPAALPRFPRHHPQLAPSPLIAVLGSLPPVSDVGEGREKRERGFGEREKIKRDGEDETDWWGPLTFLKKIVDWTAT